MPSIPKYLITWLQEHGYSQTTIDRYVSRCFSLGNHDPILCPRCFLDDTEELNEQPLLALPADAGIEPLLCRHCMTEFDVPEPN